MEIAKPSIKDAVNQCAEKGCSRVVVAPYFLSQGRHIQEDIPALVAEAQAEHPELHCIIAEPIGMLPPYRSPGCSVGQMRDPSILCLAGS